MFAHDKVIPFGMAFSLLWQGDKFEWLFSTGELEFLRLTVIL